jgi:cAMP-binding proteins - catabolite gene activator and regulatory subunit of cAMP-dependent protein kinases
MMLSAIPLFAGASGSAIAALQDQAVSREFKAGHTVLMEDAWGNAVYFVLSGWLKVRSLLANQESTTLAILGKGDVFGEMAVLDESPRSTDVVAYSEMKVISIPATAFTDFLLANPGVCYRMLQLMVKRVRKANQQAQMRQQLPAVRVANVLYSLAANYGEHLWLFPPRDIAELAQTSVDETVKVLDKLCDRQWLVVDPQQHLLQVANLKQLHQLANAR